MKEIAMTARAPFVFILFALLTTPLSAETAYELAVERGERALDADRLDEAVAAFEEALVEARRDDSRRGEAHAHFYLALTRERQADGTGDEALRARAERHYRQSIELHPTAAASNNLARLAIRTGRPDEGERLYEQAVELGSDRKAFYAANHGDFLMRQGKGADAARAYETALAAVPGDATLQRKWIASLAAVGGEAAAQGLWKLARSGEIDAAIEGALLALERSEPPDPSELLAVLTWSLARRPLDPSDPRARHFIDSMRALRPRPRLKAPLGGILSLIESPGSPPASFAWWAEQGYRELDGRPGVVRAFGAFRQLARALGDRAEQRGELDRAEAYYQLALRLNEDVPDPNAMLDLAEVYFRREDRASLTRLASEFEGRLFQGKGAAYAENAWDAIREYHRALGVMYAHLGVWENPQRPYASAIFQLEHAAIATKRVNEDPKRFGLSAPLPPEPGLTSLLGEAYEKTGQRAKSIQIRLDAAEEYVKTGDPVGANEVMRQIGTIEAIPPSLRDRHRSLERTIAPMAPIRNPGR